MDEILAKLLIEGGSLGIFVIFVLYLSKGQAAERKDMVSERAAMLTALTNLTKGHEEKGLNNMALGLASLDKVNGNIRDLVQVNVELSKALAVHDATSKMGDEERASAIASVLTKLDHISDKLKAHA